MPRKLLFRSNTLPYHVTARGNNREVFPLDLAVVWKIMSDECYLASIVFNAQIHAFVLMPNHFHLLLTVKDRDLGELMNQFMSDVSRTINRLSGRSGRIFGAPYHWSLIGSSLYFAHAFKYVYRNPVKANIVSRVEDYHWSTLHGLFGKSHCPFPVSLPGAELGIEFFSKDPWVMLDWLNEPTLAEADSFIQKGLKKKIFGDPGTQFTLIKR